ncbi:MAG: hypothetical protein JW801_16250 [Bacteroidales bacterium]|nr:hypothetical protein [Bacteroidales bacterium]
MKRNTFCTLAFTIAILLIFSSCEKENDIISGHIRKNTTWSGKISIGGDVIIDEGVTLTIQPGTIITVLGDQDETQQSQLGEPDDLTTGDPTGDPAVGGTEYHTSHIGIIVNGRIISKGTREEPIIFTSSKENPTYTDWIGLVVKNGEFEHTLVEWCLNGIYSCVGVEKLTIDNCHIRHIWAAGLGFQQPASTSSEVYVKHTTVEDCGHEAVDTHSPGTIEFAFNIIRDCQVGLNLHDEIYASAHHNIILNTTFPILCVNSQDVFITQSILQAAIQDNNRWTYQDWTMPQFQDPSALFVNNSDVSQVIITNSIIFDSPIGLRNEAPVGALANGYLNMDNVANPYYVNAVQGSGCLNVASGFIDKAGGDFKLLPTSLVKAAGNPDDGNPDLGAYGGADAEELIGCTTFL